MYIVLQYLILKQFISTYKFYVSTFNKEISFLLSRLSLPGCPIILQYKVVYFLLLPHLRQIYLLQLLLHTKYWFLNYSYLTLVRSIVPSLNVVYFQVPVIGALGVLDLKPLIVGVRHGSRTEDMPIPTTYPWYLNSYHFESFAKIYKCRDVYKTSRVLSLFTLLYPILIEQ